MSAPAAPCPVARCPNLTPCTEHGGDLTYTVVTGPPCGGKSTYVRQHSAPGDIIVDFDLIAAAISPACPPYVYPEHVRSLVRALRVAVIRNWLITPAGNLWVIDTGNQDGSAMARYRAEGATVVTIDPGIDTCLQCARTERPEGYDALIHRWYGA